MTNREDSRRKEQTGRSKRDKQNRKYKKKGYVTKETGKNQRIKKQSN